MMMTDFSAHRAGTPPGSGEPSFTMNEFLMNGVAV